MRLEINNTTKQKINTKTLRKATEVFGKRMRLGKKIISVAFVSEQRIKSLNKRYRRMDKVTDVLSFAGEGEFLGELIICYPQIKRQAEEQRHPVNYELLFIFIHGLLHLVSYDDTTKKGHKEMMELGKKISKSII